MEKQGLILRDKLHSLKQECLATLTGMVENSSTKSKFTPFNAIEVNLGYFGLVELIVVDGNLVFIDQSYRYSVEHNCSLLDIIDVIIKHERDN